MTFAVIYIKINNMKKILIIFILLFSSSVFSDETNYLKESAKKATDIYVAFFKSYLSKEISEEEKKCLIDTLEIVPDSDYVNLGPPITSSSGALDVKGFYEAVQNVKLLPNGKLLSDFDSAQAVAQPMEFISKLACKK